VLEDELRKTFEELNIQPQPRRAQAVDIIFRGATVRRRRRGYAVGAAGTGTAVVALVIAFALNQPPRQHDDNPAGPPGPDVGTSTTTSTTVQTSPTTTPQDAPSSSAESPITTSPTITTRSPNATYTPTSATRTTSPSFTGTEPQRTTTG
jgi:hypothetical protein